MPSRERLARLAVLPCLIVAIAGLVVVAACWRLIVDVANVLLSKLGTAIR